MRNFFLLSFLFLSMFSYAQTSFTSVQDGNWNDESTWDLAGGAGGTEGIDFPSASDNVVIDHYVIIDATNSGGNFSFTGDLTITSDDTLECQVGSATTGFVLEGNGIMRNNGTFFTLDPSEIPDAGGHIQIDFVCQGNSIFIGGLNSFAFIADDWELYDNAQVFIDNLNCYVVSDDVNFDGTTCNMYGSGNIRIGGDGLASTVNYNGGSTDAQLDDDITIWRNVVSTDCSGDSIGGGTSTASIPPFALDDSYTTPLNTAQNQAVLTQGNDDFSPLEGDSVTITSVGSNAGATNGATSGGGTVSVNNNGTAGDPTDDYIVYTPLGGFTGTDTYNYLIANEGGGTDIAVVTIEVGTVTDTDGDGIADDTDIDDDNDGILDTDECASGNIATSGTATQSSTASGGVASRGNDGNTNGNYGGGSVTHTSNSTNPFWLLDLGSEKLIDSIIVWNRTNGCCMARLDGYQLDIEDASNVSTFTFNNTTGSITSETTITNATGRYVRISLSGGSRILSLAEVQVFSSFCDDDNDGISNQLDLDSDNDGISDIVEAGGTDSNGDGLVDNDTDTDNDGWANTFDSDDGGTALSDPDTDSDGLENRIDIDADNDGIVDIIESQPSGTLISPSGTDSDNDGIDDNFDPDNGNTLTDPENTDGTDNPDYTDTDADNDGDLDALEGWDTNNNGIANTLPAGTDSDNDGLDDNYDNIVGPNATTNVTNNQSSVSFPNIDRGASAELEWREDKDYDGDGVSDEVDIDDDNDGILDTDEGYCIAFVLNGGFETPVLGCSPANYSVVDEGLVNGWSHSAASGATVDCGANLGGSIAEIEIWTTGFKGVPSDEGDQFCEINAHNIGTMSQNFTLPSAGTYILEWGISHRGRTGIDSMSIRIDEGANNLIDSVVGAGKTVWSRHAGTRSFTTTGTTVTFGLESVFPAGGSGNFIDNVVVCVSVDSDGDGVADYLDLDSDNDGIPDIVEAGGVDSNGDGIVDGTFDDGGNADGWSDVFDDQDGSGGTPLPVPDTDNDGKKDLYDLDSDGDGIADIVEAGGVDANGDGVGDTPADGDADGWFNTFDSDNGGTTLSDPDTDGDGLKNRIDIDSDDDGILDIIESQPSGVLILPSGNDVDSDGIDDNFDADFLGTNTLTTPENTDGTDNPDYIDTDSDNDGDLDILEGWDTDNDGVADTSPAGTDTDNDGLDDNFDNIVGPNDTTNVTDNGKSSSFYPNLDNTLTT